MLAGTLGSPHGRDKSAEDIVLLATQAEREGILGAAHKEGAGPSRGTHEGCVGLLAYLAQAVVEHVADEVVHITAPEVGHRVLLAVGRGVAFHVEVRQHDGLLLVFLDGDNHRVVVGHGVVHPLGPVLGQGDGAEEALDFLLHLVHIDVAHHDHGLQVGPVPFLVVVAQVLVGEVVYHVHRPDGHAVLILRSLVDGGQGILLHALHGHASPAGAPFLMDHATLLVDLGILEQDVVAPVVKHEEAGVEDTLTFQGCRPDVVDGLLHTGVGIEVGTEFHADGLAPGHDAQPFALAGEILRSVEGHVLQEVGESALARLLKYRPYALCDVEVGQSGLLGIVADVVSEPVFQGSFPHCRVLWQRLLCRAGRGRCEQEECDG